MLARGLAAQLFILQKILAIHLEVCPRYQTLAF
jgi:hypothetical protein